MDLGYRGLTRFVHPVQNSKYTTGCRNHRTIHSDLIGLILTNSTKWSNKTTGHATSGHDFHIILHRFSKFSHWKIPKETVYINIRPMWFSVIFRTCLYTTSWKSQIQTLDASQVHRKFPCNLLLKMGLLWPLKPRHEGWPLITPMTTCTARRFCIRFCLSVCLSGEPDYSRTCARIFIA